GVNFFLAIKQKTPNRWVSNFRGSLHTGGFIFICAWPRSGTQAWFYSPVVFKSEISAAAWQ
ncbi:hypothetical protein, partial [Pantoea agglomerans]